MNTKQHSVLGSLRALIPRQHCQFGQSLSVAERQAARLRRYLASARTHRAVESLEARLAALPRIRIIHQPLLVPSTSRWNGRSWVICLNRSQPSTRQRFALLHEFKHIIDHGHTHHLYTGDAQTSPTQQAERAADHFASHTLIPPADLQRAWTSGLRHPNALAKHFQAPTATVLVRLAQSHLTGRRPTPPANSPPPSSTRTVVTADPESHRSQPRRSHR